MLISFLRWLAPFGFGWPSVSALESTWLGYPLTFGVPTLRREFSVSCARHEHLSNEVLGAFCHLRSDLQEKSGPHEVHFTWCWDVLRTWGSAPSVRCKYWHTRLDMCAAKQTPWYPMWKISWKKPSIADYSMGPTWSASGIIPLSAPPFWCSNDLLQCQVAMGTKGASRHHYGEDTNLVPAEDLKFADSLVEIWVSNLSMRHFTSFYYTKCVLFCSSKHVLFANCLRVVFYSSYTCFAHLSSSFCSPLSDFAGLQACFSGMFEGSFPINQVPTHLEGPLKLPTCRPSKHDMAKIKATLPSLQNCRNATVEYK